ncbi:MAG: ribonucleoside reductase [Rhodospirillaceae bacterium]|nr:ribonucleoside reductase [Rhodospirillaceae bacterium]
MKYRLKGPDGAPLDKTIEETWRRVARALAEPERDAARWEAEFYSAMEDFRFLPAGRIVAGAGTKRHVTLFNCFVMGTIPDDMAGIFEHLKEAALTMQQGGGIGYDFSTLRPRGAPVKGVGADASGPLSFMDVWDAMCRTIMSAGFRRGAMMATLRCDHPDIEAFIDAKREAARLRMFNLSVLVTDAFMEAVKEDRPWQLAFDGTVYKTVAARELWDRIMRATYTFAEPGVIFIDRINQRNPLHYCETIQATNPCVTAETWVMTAEGPRQAGELVGIPFSARVDGRDFASTEQGFFATGRQPVVRLATVEGHRLRLTANHLVRRASNVSRFRVDVEWVPAGSLCPGDRIVLHDHGAGAAWPGEYGAEEGYLLGLLMGDGTLKADKAVLSVWPGRQVANGGHERPGIDGVMAEALRCARALPHRADFSGWVEVAGRGEYRLAIGKLRHLAAALGMAPGRKAMTPALERCSSEFYRGFLRGFFDADGAVLGTHVKGISVRLAQSDLDRLEAVQRMLLRLGIASAIYRDRRQAGMRDLPDGRGGRRSYATAAQHELVVSGDNLHRFAERIGFADAAKNTHLRAALAGYRRSLNRERFLARVDSILPDGEEPVFDATIPGISAFDANGLYVHNCGEQPLPPYGACLLGSLNLARFVRQPFEPEAALDLDALDRTARIAVRMMDNVTDLSRFPLPVQREEAQRKRRIGLGITGLADALIMCRVRYGSARALRLAETWMKTVQRAAYLASAELAAEKGAFPLFDRDKYLAGPAIRDLDADVRAAIAAHGLRNALLTSIAPTGTISIFADNVSSGIEPVFAFTYQRSVLMPDGSRREQEVADHAYRLFRRLKGENAPLPDYFVDAQQLGPKDHVAMQAAVQKHVDSSISKTINCPEDLSFAAFKDVYLLAYDLGCKGCTTYRPNPVTGAVLSIAGADEAAGKTAEPELPLPKVESAKPKDAFESGGVVYMTRPLDRPEALPGRTYKIRWPESDHAIYITLNDIIQDGRRRPFEVFINSKNMDHYAWTVGLTRMISAVFRRGGDVSFVVDELKAVFDPRGGQWMDRRYVPSLLAAIGDVIERHMIDIGFIPNPKEAREGRRELKIVGGYDGEAGEEAEKEGGIPRAMMRGCPKCGQRALIRQENCDICTNCDYSKCG